MKWVVCVLMPYLRHVCTIFSDRKFLFLCYQGSLWCRMTLILMTYLEGTPFFKYYGGWGSGRHGFKCALCAEGSLNLSERPRCTKNTPDSKSTMESKLTMTTVKHYGDGTQEACFLGEGGGAFSCRNTLWGFQVWKPLPPRQLLVVRHPQWRLPYIYCGTVSCGKWPSAVWTWKKLGQYGKKERQASAKGFEESEVFLKGSWHPVWGTETPKNSEHLRSSFWAQ